MVHISEVVDEMLGLIREGATTRCQLWEKNTTLIPLRDDEQQKQQQKRPGSLSEKSGEKSGDMDSEVLDSVGVCL
jgi:hypothetical protein